MSYEYYLQEVKYRRIHLYKIPSQYLTEELIAEALKHGDNIGSVDIDSMSNDFIRYVLKNHLDTLFKIDLCKIRTEEKLYLLLYLYSRKLSVNNETIKKLMDSPTLSQRITNILVGLYKESQTSDPILSLIPTQFKTEQLCLNACKNNLFNIKHVPSDMMDEEFVSKLNGIGITPVYVFFLPEHLQELDAMASALKSIHPSHVSVFLSMVKNDDIRNYLKSLV